MPRRPTALPASADRSLLGHVLAMLEDVPVGLLLAVPLTVCLVVMGRYVPRLAFIEVLLGSEPVLSPEERLCLVALSEGGEDAITYREFDVAAGQFVPGGFVLPTSKQGATWLDKDTLLALKRKGFSRSEEHTSELQSH